MKIRVGLRTDLRLSKIHRITGHRLRIATLSAHHALTAIMDVQT